MTDDQNTERPTVEEYLAEENRQLRQAGCSLAAAALYVAQEHDGVHRLLRATADWAKAVANEGGRGSAESNSAEPESVRLRKIFPKILASLENGSGCTDEATVEFLEEIPEEIERVKKNWKFDIQMSQETVKRLRAEKLSMTSRLRRVIVQRGESPPEDVFKDLMDILNGPIIRNTLHED